MIYTKLTSTVICFTYWTMPQPPNSCLNHLNLDHRSTIALGHFIESQIRWYKVTFWPASPYWACALGPVHMSGWHLQRFSKSIGIGLLPLDCMVGQAHTRVWSSARLDWRSTRWYGLRRGWWLPAFSKWYRILICVRQRKSVCLQPTAYVSYLVALNDWKWKYSMNRSKSGCWFWGPVSPSKCQASKSSGWHCLQSQGPSWGISTPNAF